MLLHFIIVLICLNVRQQVCQVACAKEDVLQAGSNHWVGCAHQQHHRRLLFQTVMQLLTPCAAAPCHS
jgi:hypothetical protein